MVLPEETLESLVVEAQKKKLPAFPVYEKGKVSGLVEVEMIKNFLRLHEEPKK